MSGKEIKISLTLTRHDIDFLNMLSNDIKFAGSGKGIKLSRAHMIRGMIRCLKKEDKLKRIKIIKRG